MTANVNISAQIPASLAKKLEKVSAFEERSKSFYIKKALENYLQEKLEDIQDLIEAKKRIREHKKSGEPYISWEEIQEKMKQEETK